MREVAEVQAGGTGFDFGRWRGRKLSEEHAPWWRAGSQLSLMVADQRSGGGSHLSGQGGAVRQCETRQC
jgi:hypothetical protein